MDAALTYADLGYRVFPCAPGSKRPLTANGFHDATTDLDQIESWWLKWPDANVAIAIDGQIVIDVDGADNPWLKDEPEKQLEVADAPQSLTANGGYQYIFHQPLAPSRVWRNTTSKLAPKVDTRGKGGYIVVPPSILGGDKQYRWQPTRELNVPPDDLPVPPPWLTELLDQADNGSLTNAEGPADGNPIPDGQRNSTLASLAGAMRRVGMTEAEILAAIQRINLDRCRPPLRDSEVAKIAASVGRYDPDGVATAVAEHHYEQDFKTGKSSGPNDPGAFPTHLLEVPGFIADVMRFNLESATRPQPVLALAGAIMLMATLVGRKVRDERGNRTNLYTVGIAPSGGGKDHARKVNRKILYHAGLDYLEANEDVASDAGLITAVEAQPAVMFQLDEFGRFLRTIGDPRRSPHLFNVLTTLMKLFSSADTTFRAKAYADSKRNKIIHQPCVGVYGTTVPEHYYESLTASSLQDGFVARLNVFEANDDPPRQRVPELDVPQHLIDVARWWGDFVAGGNLAKEIPEPHVVTATAEANEIFDRFALDIDRHMANDKDGFRSLWARAEEKACRLALIYACSRDCENPIIDDVAVRWACELSEYLTQRMIYLAAQWIADGQFDARQKKVLRAIRRAGGELSHSELYNRTRWLSPRDRQEVIENLIQTGQLDRVTTKTTTRPRTSYVIR